MTIIDAFFQENNLKYYTTWSNILFYLVIIIYILSYLFCWKLPSWILWASIANIIAVCIIGNLLCCCNFDNIMDTAVVEAPDMNHFEITRTLGVSNFVVHTLPLIISILVLLSVRSDPFKVKNAFAFLSLFALIWLLTPCSGLTCFNKINTIYSNPPIVCFLLLPIIWLIILYLTQYSQNRCEKDYCGFEW